MTAQIKRTDYGVQHDLCGPVTMWPQLICQRSTKYPSIPNTSKGIVRWMDSYINLSSQKLPSEDLFVSWTTMPDLTPTEYWYMWLHRLLSMMWLCSASYRGNQGRGSMDWTARDLVHYGFILICCIGSPRLRALRISFDSQTIYPSYWTYEVEKKVTYSLLRVKSLFYLWKSYPCKFSKRHQL